MMNIPISSHDYNTLIKIIEKCFRTAFVEGGNFATLTYEIVERIDGMYDKGIGSERQISDLNSFTLDTFNLYRNFRKSVSDHNRGGMI